MKTDKRGYLLLAAAGLIYAAPAVVGLLLGIILIGVMVEHMKEELKNN